MALSARARAASSACSAAPAKRRATVRRSAGHSGCGLEGGVWRIVTAQEWEGREAGQGRCPLSGSPTSFTNHHGRKNLQNVSPTAPASASVNVPPGHAIGDQRSEAIVQLHRGPN